jgi:hypothetical protein
MVKHCTNCGHELRETDKFCAECATPVGSTQVPSPQPLQYETCQIEYEILRETFWILRNAQLQFYADAVGPKGRYVAGRSAKFENCENLPFPEQHSAVLNDLIANLTSEGWESLGRTETAFWKYKFRRPVK